MVHPLSETVRTDEKREKRLDSLEQRAIEVENQILRTSNSALEKRVAELEASLRESNEECVKLRQTIAQIKDTEKDVTPTRKENGIGGKRDGSICKDDDKKYDTDDSDDDLISTTNKEEEIIFDRIIKLIENMKSECQKSINMKIPSESQLPTFSTRQGARSVSSSKSPSPTGIPSIVTNIPTSRTITPSGAVSPPAVIPNRQIQLTHLPSRPNTSSGTYTNTFNNNNHVSLNKKQLRPRTGSLCSSNIPSRPNTPPPSNNIHSVLSTGIPSAFHSSLPQKIQYCRRQVTC